MKEESTRWVAATLAATFGLLSAGLLAAMANTHHAWLIVLLGVLIAVPLFRRLPHRALVVGNTPTIVILLLGAVVVVSLATNVLFASELVVTGRDGATYANEARSLVSGTGLLPRAVTPEFTGIDGLGFEAPGFVLRDDGRLYQQFLHATPAFFALAGELLGPSAIFWGNAILGAAALGAVFALSRRFVGPWLSLWVVLALAVSYPFVYYARSTYSEIGALLLAAGGTWAGLGAIRSEPRSEGFAAGVLLGGVALVRVDGWMLGVSVAAFGVTAVLSRSESRRVIARSMWLGFLVSAILGMADLLIFSTPYVGILGLTLPALMSAAVLLRILSSVLEGREAGRGSMWLDAHRNRVASVAAYGFGVLTLLLWFVRPLLTETRGSPYGLAGIQAANGLPVDPTRAYSELSLWWQAWYLGIPIALAGWAAIAAGIRRWIAGRSPTTAFAVLVAVVPALVYGIRPSVNPDHPWAIRRFLPVVIPALVIGSAIVLRWVGERLSARVELRGARPLLALGVLAPIVMTTAPLFAFADGKGGDEVFAQACAHLGSNPVVAMVDDGERGTLATFFAQPLRTWCGVPVATATPAARDDALGQVAGRLASAQRLVVLSLDENEFEPEPSEVIVGDLRFVQETLTRPPYEARRSEFVVYGWELVESRNGLQAMPLDVDAVDAGEEEPE